MANKGRCHEVGAIAMASIGTAEASSGYTQDSVRDPAGVSSDMEADSRGALREGAARMGYVCVGARASARAEQRAYAGRTGGGAVAR